MAEPTEIVIAVLSRLAELVKAPLIDHKMLWAAAPLVIATLFMTLYFGKYRKEELGWNTAFGNTMVFLFVSINIIQYMYYSDGTGSWDNVLSNEFYFSITVILAAIALFFMFIVYYHLLPKRVVFFLFSAPPVNVSVYVLMTMVYTGVPVDYITLAAAVLLFLIIFIGLKFMQKLEAAAGRPEGVFAPEEKSEKPKKKKKTSPKEAEETEE
jgi:hypothetical protein